MRNPENVLNSLQEHSAQSGYVYDRLYRNLFNREFFLQAYQNIYALLKQKEFRWVQIGGIYRISKQSFDEWLDKKV